MKKRFAQETIKIPENIDVSVDQNKVQLKGLLANSNETSLRRQ